jgi:hypothetical protein
MSTEDLVDEFFESGVYWGNYYGTYYFIGSSDFLDYN